MSKPRSEVGPASGSERPRGAAAAGGLEAAGRVAASDCASAIGKRFTVKLPFQPPFVILSDPEEIKELFTAPPDVLHPGEGARVLEPLIGRNSVILLDEAPHLEQRKLLLPAFHGERMQRAHRPDDRARRARGRLAGRASSRSRCIRACSA